MCVCVCVCVYIISKWYLTLETSSDKGIFGRTIVSLLRFLAGGGLISLYLFLFVSVCVSVSVCVCVCLFVLFCYVFCFVFATGIHEIDNETGQYHLGMKESYYIM